MDALLLLVTIIILVVAGLTQRVKAISGTLAAIAAVIAIYVIIDVLSHGMH